MSAQDLEKTLAEVLQLSPEDRLRLIKSIAKTMGAPRGAEARGSLIYVQIQEFRGGLHVYRRGFQVGPVAPN